MMPAPRAAWGAGDAPRTVGDISRLINAMDRFVSEHTGFESSTIGDAVQKEMAAAPSINQAALIPIRHKIFSFDVALKWGCFLAYIAPRLSEDGGGLPDPFHLLSFHTEICMVYDIAMNNFLDFCAEEESEELSEPEDIEE